MNISTIINNKIRELGKKPAWLSKTSGISESVVYRLVNDEQPDIKLSTAIKIAQVLDMSLDEFK